MAIRQQYLSGGVPLYTRAKENDLFLQKKPALAEFYFLDALA